MNEYDVDKFDGDNDCDPSDIGQEEQAATISRRIHNMSTQGNRLGNMVRDLLSANNSSWLDGSHCSPSQIWPMLLAMVVIEQAGVRMIKEYFKIEASKSTPQYRFKMGLKPFGDEGC